MHRKWEMRNWKLCLVSSLLIGGVPPSNDCLAEPTQMEIISISMWYVFLWTRTRTLGDVQQDGSWCSWQLNQDWGFWFLIGVCVSLSVCVCVCACLSVCIYIYIIMWLLILGGRGLTLLCQFEGWTLYISLNIWYIIYYIIPAWPLHTAICAVLSVCSGLI